MLLPSVLPTVLNAALTLQTAAPAQPPATPLPATDVSITAPVVIPPASNVAMANPASIPDAKPTTNNNVALQEMAKTKATDSLKELDKGSSQKINTETDKEASNLTSTVGLSAEALAKTAALREPADTPTVKQAGSMSNFTLLGGGLTLALGSIAAYLGLRRRQQQVSGKALRIVDSISLGKDRHLVVAAVGGQNMLLGVSEAGIHFLPSDAVQKNNSTASSTVSSASTSMSAADFVQNARRAVMGTSASSMTASHAPVAQDLPTSASKPVIITKVELRDPVVPAPSVAPSVAAAVPPAPMSAPVAALPAEYAAEKTETSRKSEKSDKADNADKTDASEPQTPSAEILMNQLAGKHAEKYAERHAVNSNDTVPNILDKTKSKTESTSAAASLEQRFAELLDETNAVRINLSTTSDKSVEQNTTKNTEKNAEKRVHKTNMDDAGAMAESARALAQLFKNRGRRPEQSVDPKKENAVVTSNDSTSMGDEFDQFSMQLDEQMQRYDQRHDQRHDQHHHQRRQAAEKSDVSAAPNAPQRSYQEEITARAHGRHAYLQNAQVVMSQTTGRG